MLEALFYMNMSCPDTDALILRIQKNQNLEEYLKVELVETVKESNSKCYWDAHD